MGTKMSLCNLMHNGIKRTTKRRQFFGGYGKVVPFANWAKIIEPYYYVKGADGRGRPPIDIDKMLRMYLLQVWFSICLTRVGGQYI